MKNAYRVQVVHKEWGDATRLVIADSAESAISKTQKAICAEAGKEGIKLRARDFKCRNLTRLDEEVLV